MTLLVTLATSGGHPTAISAGNVTSGPPPGGRVDGLGHEASDGGQRESPPAQIHHKQPLLIWEVTMGPVVVAADLLRAGASFASHLHR